MDNIEELLNPSLNNEQSEESNDGNEVTIPVNSPTVLLDEQHSRFSSALWYDKIRNSNITLAGLGGIGSWTALLLARLGPRYIYAYDDDIVEAGNMSGQLYRTNDINCSKVHSTSEIAKRFASYHGFLCYKQRFTEDSIPGNTMICGFDNMASRKMFYNKWKNHALLHPENSLFIDGRLNAEELQIFCIRGNDSYHMEKYENECLFSDEEADQTVCSYKQTSHCASMIASLIVNLYTNFMANKCEPLIERDVPFLTYYNAETMYFKTES